jgi:ribosomal protein S18 acetylase RimI-like enzyme
MTTDQMEIRPLIEDDTIAWRELRLRMLREHPDAFGSAYEEQAPWPLERFAQRLREADAPDNFLLGAFEDGKLVGSVAMGREEGMKNRHKAGIFSMYVAPEAHGRGVGRALLAEVIARARALPGIEQLQLAVTTHNTAARNLYAALGFAPYGVERHALKIGDRYFDEELMVLWLREEAGDGRPPDAPTGRA